MFLSMNFEKKAKIIKENYKKRPEKTNKQTNNLIGLIDIEFSSKAEILNYIHNF